MIERYDQNNEKLNTKELSDNQSNSFISKLTIWQRKLRWLPALLWMGVIFYLSSKTGDELNQVMPFFQKYLPFIEDFNWGHYVSYFILAMTIDYGFGAKASKWTYKIAIVIICTLYGVSDEIHQYFVGGRMMDMIDVRNDAIGATLWVIIAKLPFISRLWKKLCYDR